MIVNFDFDGNEIGIWRRKLELNVGEFEFCGKRRENGMNEEMNV